MSGYSAKELEKINNAEVLKKKMNGMAYIIAQGMMLIIHRVCVV